MGDRLLRLAERLDEAVLHQVFTHSSLVVERSRSYERLEFLGDSVLSLCITTELYRRFPGYAEGHLARLRAYIVSRATCAKVAERLKLGTMLRELAGRGHDDGEIAQLMVNQNVLADLTEALIGAIYVTFGYEAVRPAVVEAFDEHIEFARSSYVDHKTELQENLAKMGRTVSYRVVDVIGPPHDRQFEIEASVDGEIVGHGVGRSKKRAEQEAAEEALRELTVRARRKSRRARLRTRRKPAEGDAPSGPSDDAEGDEPFDAGGESKAVDATGAEVETVDATGAEAEVG
jgi:ribonuclease-3